MLELFFGDWFKGLQASDINYLTVTAFYLLDFLSDFFEIYDNLLSYSCIFCLFSGCMIVTAHQEDDKFVELSVPSFFQSGVYLLIIFFFLSDSRSVASVSYLSGSSKHLFSTSIFFSPNETDNSVKKFCWLLLWIAFSYCSCLGNL